MLIHQIANKHLNKAVYQKGGDGGAGAQAKATQKGIDLQREMWQTNMQNLAPFTPLAQQYVSQLQNLSTLQGQGQALNDYYNSQQYKDLAGQARYQSLMSAEATGGLGSTATGNQLAAIAPTLGQNWLSGQMNNYQNLANIGLGALTGQANAGQNYANNASQLYQQQANAAAANANRPSGFQNFATGALSGAATGAAVGSVVPVIGTAAGAIGGGIIGGLGSLF
ncbi:TPA: DNA transfer protein [Klebsiella aerogenes]